MSVSRIAILFCAFLILITGITFASPDCLEELEKSISENISDIKTMIVDFEQTILISENNVLNASGKMYFLLPEKLKMIFATEMMGQQMRNTMINDGKTLWTESRLGKEFVQVYKVDADVMEKLPHLSQLSDMQNQNMSFDQIFNILKTIKAHYSLEWKGKKKLDDHDVYEVEAVLSEDGKKALHSFGPSASAAATMGAKQRLFFDSKNSLLRKILLFNDNNVETLSFTFTNHRTNVPLEPILFEYSPPEKARIIDMTPIIEQMMLRPEQSRGDIQ